MKLADMNDEQLAEHIAKLEGERAAAEEHMDSILDRKREICRALDALRGEREARAEIAKLERKTGRRLVIAPPPVESAEAFGNL